VGLIEYNGYKFGVERREEGGFAFRGLRVVVKPSYKSIRQHQLDNATSCIVKRRIEDPEESLYEELLAGC